MPGRMPDDLWVDGVDLGSTSWINLVAATQDADLRAHRIALTYSKLATWLDDLIYEGQSVRSLLKKRKTPQETNANWFHFAMWGTLTVTQNIGTDRAPQRLNTGPATALRRLLTPAITQARAADGQLVGRALAWGQLLIFVSASLAMQRFGAAPSSKQFQLVDDDEGELLGQGNLIDFLGSWDEAHFVKVERHVKSVEQAFEWLRQARGVQGDPSVQDRLLLGATVLLTAVEQDLVDPALHIVVELAPKRLAHALEVRAAKWGSRLSDIPAQVSALTLPHRYPKQRDFVQEVWSRLMTDQVLVMALPAETLRLGRDIPPRRAGHPFCPPELRRLGPSGDEAKSADPSLREVERLVSSIDRTVGDGRGSAARDWRRWDDRMNWAVALFRSRQRDPTLFWPPYSESDQIRIVRGQLPRRGADPSALEVQAPLDGSVFLSNGDDPADRPAAP